MLTHQHFAPLVGQHFRTEWEGGATELRLSEVRPLPAPRRRDSAGVVSAVTEGPFRQEPFSLMFNGPLETFLEQRMYRMTPANGDSVEIFLVPIRRESDSYVYQAVFG